MKNNLKTISKLAEALGTLTIPNADGVGTWEHEIGYEIIALDGEITVLIGDDFPDVLYDAVENLAIAQGIKIIIDGEMSFNESCFKNINTETVNGGPNEWYVE